MSATLAFPRKPIFMGKQFKCSLPFDKFVDSLKTGIHENKYMFFMSTFSKISVLLAGIIWIP